jgi:hypothetical protein
VLADFSRPGEVVLGASRLGEVPPVSGHGTVATITFRALLPGVSEVRFRQAQALAANLAPLAPVSAEPARIEVKAGRPAGERPPRPPQES